jgi:hypothetical protein
VKRFAALIVLVTWALLLVVGLVGGSVSWLPHTVTITAGLIALISGWLFIPAGTLFAFVLERRRGAIRKQGSSAFAIRFRWPYLIGGGFSCIYGLALLAPTTASSLEFKLGGVVLLVWGILALCVAVLAFRTKELPADAGRLS